MSEDTEGIKEVARSLASSNNEDAVKRGAELLKLASEIENQRSQTAKAQEELADLRKLRKSKNLKELVALLAPLVTTIVLAATLIVQGFQFARTERDKDIEAQRQQSAAMKQAMLKADEAEDASWADALKLLTTTEKISPAAVLLKQFANSPKHAEPARKMSETLLLLKSSDSQAFQLLFGSVFVPVRWNNLSQVTEIDRQLYQPLNRLLGKAWDEKRQVTDWKRIRPAEKKQYDELNAELSYISGQLALLIKSPRPAAQSLDFHSLALWDTDMQGADLSRADITASNLSNLNLGGANLSGITKFESVAFPGSTWWDSATVSPELLAYLKQNYPLDPTVSYASARKYTREEYEAAVARLSTHRN